MSRLQTCKQRFVERKGNRKQGIRRTRKHERSVVTIDTIDTIHTIHTVCTMDTVRAIYTIDAVDTVDTVSDGRSLEFSAVKLAVASPQALCGLLGGNVALRLGHHFIADLKLANRGAS